MTAPSGSTSLGPVLVDVQATQSASHRDRFGLGIEAVSEQTGQLVERADNVFLAHVVRAQRIVERADRLRSQRPSHGQEPLPSTRSA